MSSTQDVHQRAANVGEQSITIIPMRPEHVDEVTQVHLDNFPGFFLTFLGSTFLKLLYSEIVETPDHAAFVARDVQGKIVGFVAGVRHQSGFYSRLARQRWFPFALASLGAIIRRPSIVPRLFRALRYSKTAQIAASEALLMAIAVEREMNGHGIGQRLVSHFLDAMKQKNVGSVSLTTDLDRNDRINRFYKQLGFQLARTYVTPEGRRLNEYVFNLIAMSSSPSL